MKRTYELQDDFVVAIIYEKSYEIIEDFLNMEIAGFPDIIPKVLESVLLEGINQNSFGGNMLNIEFDKNLITIEHQMDEDYLAKPCSIDTLTFYKLIKEFLYVKRELKT